VSIQNALASVAVKDLKSASQWYERLFRRAPDSKPMAEVAEWKFAQGGWLQVYQLPERAGKGSVTLAVSDLKQQIIELKECGISAGTPMQGPGVSVVMIKDPDGNSIAFAEAADPDKKAPAR
jgi:predicted enzyme related to lactoylglutathione lyase